MSLIAEGVAGWKSLEEGYDRMKFHVSRFRSAPHPKQYYCRIATTILQSRGSNKSNQTIYIHIEDSWRSLCIWFDSCRKERGSMLPESRKVCARATRTTGIGRYWVQAWPMTRVAPHRSSVVIYCSALMKSFAGFMRFLVISWP